MSALLVTHDQEEALSFADRIAVMNDGRIEQVGTPEEVYYRPATEFVAQFLGQTNIFTATATGGREIMTPLGPINLDREAIGDVLCSIRPEHLTIERPSEHSDSQQVGIVASREFKGHDITYQVEFGATRYLVHTDNRVLFEPSDEVMVKPLEHAVVLRS
jgi:ABC-type spermidine/putrescine transport systems, ATPase components